MRLNELKQLFLDILPYFLSKSDDEAIVKLRNGIIDKIYYISLIFGGISYLFSSLAYFSQGSFNKIVYLGVIYIYFSILFFVKKISYSFKGISISLILLLIGIILILEKHSFPAGVVWLTIFPVISIVFIGRKSIVYSLATNIAIFLIIGLAIEYRTYYFELNVDFLDINSWLAITSASFLLSLMLAFLFSYLVTSLNKTLIEEQKITELYKNELRNTSELVNHLKDEIEVRARTDKELVKINHRLKVAQNYGQVGLWDFNISEKVYWFSEQSLSILGFDKQQEFVLLSELENSVHPNDLEQKRKIFSQAIHFGEPYKTKFRIIDSTTKNTKWIYSIADNYIDDNGVKFLVGSLRDVTEEILMTEALHKSELWFKNIFDNALDGIYLIKDYKYILVNQAGRELFKVLDNQIIGSTPYAYSPEFQPDDIDSKTKAKYLIDKVIAEGYLKFEWLHKDSNDNIFLVEVNLSSFIYETEYYVLAVLRDITEKKKYETEIMDLNAELEQRVIDRTISLNQTLEEFKYENEERKRTQEELYRLQDELIYSLSKAQELNNLKSKFIQMASHEYRTPLTAILSATYLLEVNKDSNDRITISKNIEIIKQSVIQMTNLMEEIFELESADKSNYNLNITKVEIVNFIYSIAKEAKTGMNFISNINISSSQKEIIINSDPSALRSIISKLINNAIKYSNETVIDIEIEADKDNLFIKITDAGIGIPSADLENIFEMFYKSSVTTQNKGVGLGLTIVKKYIDLLNGKINIKSEIGVGTEVIISIPKDCQT